MFWSLTAGVAIFALLARYLRRRRGPAYQGLYRKLGGKRVRGSGIRSPNGGRIFEIFFKQTLHTLAYFSLIIVCTCVVLINACFKFKFTSTIKIEKELCNFNIDSIAVNKDEFNFRCMYIQLFAY